MNRLLENAVNRPALVKGVGDFMGPVWQAGETRIAGTIPLWAIAIGGLAYLLWQANPGFGLKDWMKTKVSSW